VLTVATLLLVTAFTAAPDTIPVEGCASRTPNTGIAAFVVMAPASRTARDTMVSATVCVVPARSHSGRFASYHGELHFDSTAARVLRVIKPGEGMRVENTTPAGRVRFAGAAPAGFPEGALLTVLLRVRTPGARPALRLQMLEMNGTDGRSLLKQLVTTQPRQ
jgi:hypothetical protein